VAGGVVHSPRRGGLMHRILAAAALSTGCICLAITAVGAHHSVAVNFDQSKSVSVTGRIKELDMRNPHSQITLDVPPAGGGSAVEWFIEWSDVNSLIRRSVPYDQLKIGDEVTITVSPSRRLPNVGYFRQAVLPGGKILRDCGFGAFRRSVARGSTEIDCGDQR
jgi:hypothetical protein